MFASIRRHQKWLWIIISTVTIVSFVAFFSPNQGTSSGRSASGTDAVGSINGRPITRDQYLDSYQEAQLRYLFSYNRWPENDEGTRKMVLDPETRHRLLLIEKLREFDVKVGEVAVADWIAEMPLFQDRDQKGFRKENYDQFVKQFLRERGVSAKDFERYIRHEIGIQHLITVVGLSGKLVTPQEAEAIFRRENEQVDTEVVFLTASNYLAGITVDPAELATFYTNQLSSYRIPERAQVSYVKFEATNYLAEADQKVAALTNLTQIIDTNYQQRGTNAFTDANQQPLPPEAAKQKIREELRHSFALNEARRKANEFTDELLQMPPQTNNLPNLAAAKGFLSKVTEPFSENEGPPGLNAPQTFGQLAFKLSPQEPISDQPIVGENDVYVIGWNKKIPSTFSPLESIREKVVEDYRRNKARELVRNFGTSLHNTLANALGQGKTFQATVAEANLTAIDLPPFSRQTTMLPELKNQGNLSALKNAAFALTPGKISPFTPAGDNGFVIHLQAKVPVSDAQVKSELPESMAKLRNSRQFEAFGEWLRKEMELARIELPGDKEKQNAKQ
jgi:hypothetical protein